MGEQQFVIFRLDKEEYGLEITTVEEILKYQKITNIPQADEFVLGVINLRGKVIPIYDLKMKFTGNKTEFTEDTRIVVISCMEISVGILVDSVSEVLKIPEENIDLTKDIFSAKCNEAIIGIGKLDNRLLMLIDIKVLFSEAEKQRIEKIS